MSVPRATGRPVPLRTIRGTSTTVREARLVRPDGVKVLVNKARSCPRDTKAFRKGLEVATGSSAAARRRDRVPSPPGSISAAAVTGRTRPVRARRGTEGDPAAAARRPAGRGVTAGRRRSRTKSVAPDGRSSHAEPEVEITKLPLPRSLPEVSGEPTVEPPQPATASEEGLTDASARRRVSKASRGRGGLPRARRRPCWRLRIRPRCG